MITRKRSLVRMDLVIVTILIVAALLSSGCVRLKLEVPSELVEVETDAQQVRRTMSEMRSLGIALDAHIVKRGGYPVLSGTVDIGPYSFAPFERLEPDLDSLAFPLSAIDPWQHPYLYWSNGARYAIVSTGSDGVIRDTGRLQEALDAALSSGLMRPRYTKCLEDEILSVHGNFLLRPNQRVRPCE